MQRRRFLTTLGLAALAPRLPLQAQGFAGLGAGSDFALPKRGRRFRFPDDHLSHPEFRIEWWYLTANLTDETGADWGVQWTLFRSALEPGAPERQVWMGHAALTSRTQHLTSQRLGRSGQAGVADEGGLPLAWIDDWQMRGDAREGLEISASGPDFAWSFGAEATGPIVLQGEQGFSVKSANGTASHYFSQPFLSLTGEVETREARRRLKGIGWLDREWSSEPLAADQSGWDWFSLSFSTGEKLMAFTVRGQTPYRTAAWIYPDGRIETLPPGSLLAEPLDWAEVAGHRLPIRHRLRLPKMGLEIEVSALNPDCWMPMLVAYWEGPVTVSGSHQGKGYLEMTGYDQV